MPQKKPQRCSLHQMSLVPGGRRFGMRGMFAAPSYFEVCQTRFPHANALRIGACTGRLRDKPISPYCPQCREELQAWCREEIDQTGDSKLLAEGFLKELFSDS